MWITSSGGQASSQIPAAAHGWVAVFEPNLAKLRVSTEASAELPADGVSYSAYTWSHLLLNMSAIYQWTGDTAWFNSTPGIKDHAYSYLQAWLDCKWPNVTLFPSATMFDSTSPGDYHTGSNAQLSYCFSQMGRVASAAWDDPAKATLWSTTGTNCLADLKAYCVYPDSKYGTQFYEGTKANHTGFELWGSKHDPEEVVVGEMPLLGLIEQDDPRYTRKMKSVFDSTNYLYAQYYGPQIDAVEWRGSSQDMSGVWVDGWTGGASAPAWLCRVEGATTNAELLNAFTRDRKITDVDGSVWWWPYNMNETNPANIQRRRCYGESGWGQNGFADLSKVDYYTSVYCVNLVSNVMGLTGDCPNHTVKYRPIIPFSSLTWTDGRLGDMKLDLTYTDNGSTITASITNRNAVAYNVLIEVTVPEGKKLSGVAATGHRYGRESYAVTNGSLGPNATLNVSINYTTGDPPPGDVIGSGTVVLASADSANLEGTVTNSYTNTQASDNQYESIREIATLTYEKAPNRGSGLDHTWRFDSVPTATIGYRFEIEAYHSSNTEGDDFEFLYSKDGYFYNPMVKVTKTADDGVKQTFSIHDDISGTPYVRVVDTSDLRKQTGLDTVYIDYMAIVAVSGGSAPGQATNPSPANGATGVSTTATLSWTAGTGATSHDVYFGTSNPPAFIQNQTGTTYNPGTMSAGTTYYWRVDERNGSGTTTGTVWSFTTAGGGSPPGQATNPNPANGATGCSTSTVVSWTAGTGAASHDIWFGESQEASMTFRGNQTSTTYNPGTLKSRTFYYWRIDERNAYGMTTGIVWRFKTR